MGTDDHPTYNNTVVSASEIGPISEKTLSPYFRSEDLSGPLRSLFSSGYK